MTMIVASCSTSSRSIGGAPLAGAAVYLWQCDRDGNYLLYSDAAADENYLREVQAADENYLRGVQAADDNGLVTFTSIFPACYPGRWPHLHVEVYPSLELATNEANKIATSQVALPKDACDAVYATDACAVDNARTFGRLVSRR